MIWLLILGVLSFFVLLCESKEVVVDLEVTYGKLQPDGYERTSFLINGQFPGPTIRVHQGDLAIIRLRNNISDKGVSLHIHGIDARNSNFYDGVAHGTQSPVSPGEMFEHRLNITDPPGTYWYHGHYSLQSHFMFGAFIIEHKPAETVPYRYDEERLVLLSDWYHAPEKESEEGLEHSPFVWIGNPQSILVNGRGRHKCNLTEPCSADSAYQMITVSSNKTYRFRFIGTTSLSYMSVYLQNHIMTIIEVDGYYVHPYNVSTLEINSGQRYSVLITTNQKPDNYWMEIQVHFRHEGPMGFAVLHYDSAAPPELSPKKYFKARNMKIPAFPTVSKHSKIIKPNWILSKLRPLELFPYSKPPSKPNKTIFLVGKQTKFFVNKDEFYIKWAINDWIPEDYEPSVPLLYAIYNQSNFRAKQYPLIFEINSNDTIDIVLQNTAALNGICEQHPWHLHGYHFWDLGQGPGDYYDQVKTGNLKRYLNTENPLFRDTTTLYPTKYMWHNTNTSNAGRPCGFRVLRVKANNPGLWVMHCHIPAHMHIGMMVYFLENREFVIRDGQNYQEYWDLQNSFKLH